MSTTFIKTFPLLFIIITHVTTIYAKRLESSDLKIHYDLE